MIRKLVIFSLTGLLLITLCSCSKEPQEYIENEISKQTEIELPSPVESEAELPEETATPEPSEMQQETTVVETPEASEPSESSEIPQESTVPDIPEPSEIPQESTVPEIPEPSEIPQESTVPDMPEPSETPKDTTVPVAPEVSEMPEISETPQDTEVPGPSEEPDTESDSSHYIPVPEEWNLIVVNKWNKIPDGYSQDLMELANGEKVDSRIYTPLQEMFEDALSQNIYLIVRDGYRTTEEQQVLLDERIQTYLSQGYSQEQAEQKAKEWVAIPGTSEHELGLAVDINPDPSKVYNAFAYTWLKNNSYKYGFILRYPSDKTDITGISYEPWHFRYVGVEAAAEIYQLEVCLEEYVQTKYQSFQ